MADTINVPDKPGVGGVLSVYVEDGALGATWAEINQALNDGWIVCAFEIAADDFKATIVTEATVDESGEDPVYEITVGNTTYETTDPKKKPEVQEASNLVGSAIVGTATAG